MQEPNDANLRKWCLERAIAHKDLHGPSHLVVTNLANEYYRWIVNGETHVVSGWAENENEGSEPCQGHA